jgi:predicted Zn finger-like uncharacterized protein
MATSSSMYTTRRLRLLGQAAREPELVRWSQSILSVRKQLAPAQPPVQAAPAAGSTAGSALAPPRDSIRVVCTKCHSAMRIPLEVLRGKSSLNVRCPQCQNVITLRPKPVALSVAAAEQMK